MAEYYGIYDYRKHSALYIATLAYGLPESSRSRMNLNDTKATFEQLMLASISDSLAWLKWSKTKNAQNGLDMPKSTLRALLGLDEDKQVKGFDTGDDFLKAFRNITGE